MDLQHFPEIIQAAAESPLGILALVLLLLSSLAVVFFKKSSDGVRLAVWVGMAALGSGLFLAAAVREAPEAVGEEQRDEERPDAEHAQEASESASRASPVGADPASPPPTSKSRPDAAGVTPVAAGGTSNDGPARGTIHLDYAGDVYGCDLTLRYTLGDRTFSHAEQRWQVTGVSLGVQTYRVTGRIRCPLIGSCSASSTGVTDVRAGETYHVNWASLGGASCEVALLTETEMLQAVQSLLEF